MGIRNIGHVGWKEGDLLWVTSRLIKSIALFFLASLWNCISDGRVSFLLERNGGFCFVKLVTENFSCWDFFQK